ncbi:MAG: hypothetical protein KAI43_04335 [Candidatus Aureabacteria bacterium]|nr:hypothetical protein [Candidatus Auribacterota bacterium]
MAINPSGSISRMGQNQKAIRSYSQMQTQTQKQNRNRKAQANRQKTIQKKDSVEISASARKMQKAQYQTKNSFAAGKSGSRNQVMVGPVRDIQKPSQPAPSPGGNTGGRG